MLIFEMKIFIKKILWFVLFFAVFTVFINTVFLTVIAFTDWDFIKRRESLNFDNPAFEVLVFGTSLAEYGIDTELLSANGLESYNLSFVGSNIKTNFIQLEEYLTRYKVKPSVVLVGVNSFLENFNHDGIQPVIEFTMKGHKYGIRDFPISKFNWAGMELLKKLLRTKYRQTYLSYGQKKCSYSVPDRSNINDHILDINEYESAVWIREISRLCSDYGIELILIEMPGVRDTQNISPVGPYTISYNNGDSAVLYNFNHSEFCNFIDYEADWAGLSHFNKFGAEKFTRELLVRVFNDRVDVY